MTTSLETLDQINTEQAFQNLFDDSTCVRPAEIIFDERLSREFGADIHILSELGQRTGAYKFRGAYNWFTVNTGGNADEVVAFSAGNHAAAVASCAKHFDTRSTIFMPANTPAFKVDLVRRLGGNSVSIVLDGLTVDDAARAGRKYMEDSTGNPAFIHPFDDPHVVSGQGTLGIELMSELPDTEVVVAPVGGGGLLSGIIDATRVNGNLHYVAAEPAGAASLANNLRFPDTPLPDIDTFVDGAAVRQVGRICLETISGNADRVTLAHPDNTRIRGAVTRFWEDTRHLLRPELAGALSVAALDSVREMIMGKTVVCVMSGGNLSHERYAQEIRLV